MTMWNDPTALRMPRGALPRAVGGDFAEVAIVTRRFVTMPGRCGQRRRCRHGRQRVLDARELPDAAALDVEQKGRL